MAGREVQYTISLNGKNFSSDMGKLIQMNKRMDDSVKQVGHSTVSSMQASSAAIRSLENPMGNNIRAVERFITLVPGIGTALKAAFPIVGAIAFLSVIVKTTEELAKWSKTQSEAGAKLKEAFADLKDKGIAANDTLQLQNDKLKEQIGILNGKPAKNELAIMLDDARIMADKLLASLKEDMKAVADLMKENQAGMLQRLMGEGATDDVQDNINKKMKALEAARRAVRDNPNDKNAQKQVADAKKDIDSYLATQIKERSDTTVRNTGQYTDLGEEIQGTYAQMHGNQDKNLTVLRGVQDLRTTSDNNEQLQADIATKEQTKQGILDRKKLAGEAKSALTKAQEEILKAMNDFHTRFQDAGVKTEKDEMDFWAEQVSITQAGGIKFAKAHAEAVKNLANERQKMYRNTAEEGKKWDDQTGATDQANGITDLHRFTPDLAADPETTRSMEATSKAQIELLKSLNEGISLTRQFKAAQDDEALSQMVATGGLDAHSAAIARFNMHQQQSLDLIEELQKQGASPDTIKKAQDDATLQAQQDQNQILNTSFEGKWKTTLNDMANDFTDFGGQLTGVFKNAVNSINDEIVTLLTSKHHTGMPIGKQFEQIGHDAFTGIAKAGVQNIEGNVMKSFGIASGKLGTKNNPMYTRDADPLNPQQNSGGNFLSRIFGKSSDDGSGDSSTTKGSGSGGIMGFFSKLLGGGGGNAGGDGGDSGGLFSSDGSGTGADWGGFSGDDMPMMATGGPLDGNSPAIIGEKGPELWVPKTSGTVVPNDIFKQPSTNQHHVSIGHIDARGSTNPTVTHQQVMAAVVAGVKESHKSIPKSINEHRMRHPRSAMK